MSQIAKPERSIRLPNLVQLVVGKEIRHAARHKRSADKTWGFKYVRL